MTDICCVLCIQCCQANLKYSHLEFNLSYLILPIPERPLGPWCECISHSASMQHVILLQFVIKKKSYLCEERVSSFSQKNSLNLQMAILILKLKIIGASVKMGRPPLTPNC